MQTNESNRFHSINSVRHVSPSMGQRPNAHLRNQLWISMLFVDASHARRRRVLQLWMRIKSLTASSAAVIFLLCFDGNLFMQKCTAETPSRREEKWIWISYADFTSANFALPQNYECEYEWCRRVGETRCVLSIVFFMRKLCERCSGAGAMYIYYIRTLHAKCQNTISMMHGNS